MRKKPDIREKVLKNGITFPSNKELIMLLLGTGIKGFPVDILAEKVLNIILASTGENIIQELLKVEGIGPSKAITIGAAIEFGRRQNIHRGKQILKPSDAIPYIQHYAMQQQEHFICITLSGAHEIIRIVPVSVGTINKTMVHPREVFSCAIKDMAAAVIVCHNHPSGSCIPSQNDLRTTEQLLEASECLGIKMLDHIILSQNNYFSFKEQGLFLADY